MKSFRLTKKLMGSAFEFIINDENEFFARECLQKGVKEVNRLEKKLTEFDTQSLTSEINQNAGIRPVCCDTETFELINRSIQLSKITQGAFDITAPTLHKLYNFKNKAFEFPGTGEIEKILKISGHKNIQLLENNKVFLRHKGMHINFAAIGKGYAADTVKRLWIKMGVKNGLINASGDLSVLGKNIHCESWTAGIPNPLNKSEILFHIPLGSSSIATSGNYEQFFHYKGQKYSHNINPKTGLPLTKINSCSVISPSAELSDALSTAISVLDTKVGLHLINQLPNTYAIIINDKNDIFYSENIKLFTAAI